MKKIALFLCMVFLTLSIFGCQRPEEDVPKINTQACARYADFEEHLDFSTDIFKGKCVASTEHDDCWIYEFEVIERYVGEPVEGPIHLYVPKNYVTSVDKLNISIAADAISYVPDESYYLLLTRYMDVYGDYDRYINTSANIYIPASHPSKSTMYGEELSKHSELKNYDTEQTITTYIQEYLSQHPNSERELYLGTRYISSNDMRTIISQSDFVLKVTLDESVYEESTRTVYDCTVISCMKGDVEEQSKVRIPFPPKTVSKGKEYIVALFEVSQAVPRAFAFSSKASLFQSSQENEIVKYIP